MQVDKVRPCWHACICRACANWLSRDRATPDIIMMKQACAYVMMRQACACVTMRQACACVMMRQACACVMFLKMVACTPLWDITLTDFHTCVHENIKTIGCKTVNHWLTSTR